MHLPLFPSQGTPLELSTVTYRHSVDIHNDVRLVRNDGFPIRDPWAIRDQQSAHNGFFEVRVGRSWQRQVLRSQLEISAPRAPLGFPCRHH